MASIKHFEDLEVWQLARAYYRKLSFITEKLRKHREFRFAEQIKSSAGSIMDNIAEGFERSSRLEFLNALSIAKGECGESRSQIHRLADDKFIEDPLYNELLEDSDKLSRKIANFVLYLNSTEIRGLKFKDRRK